MIIDETPAHSARVRATIDPALIATSLRPSRADWTRCIVKHANFAQPAHSRSRAVSVFRGMTGMTTKYQKSALRLIATLALALPLFATQLSAQEVLPRPDPKFNGIIG
jgi:hypothetical protein